MKLKNHMLQGRKPLGRLLGAALFCLLLSACAGQVPRQELHIQWPPPPAPPQVAWVSEISDYREAGIRKGFWRGLADLVVGESDLHIGRPYGVHVDDTGRLLIADTAFGVVHAMDAAENSYTVIGQAERSTAFKNPIAVTEDDAGNAYITDPAVGVVYRYRFLDNTLTPFIQALERPTGIAFNKRNRLLYVSDTTANQVAVYDLNGNARFQIGNSGSGPGQFNRPTDLFVDASGTLYITDSLNTRIQIFSASGTFRRAFGTPGDGEGEFFKPKGVAVDSDGNIYVVDTMADAVKVFTPLGVYRFAFGSPGSEAGRFWLPSGICIDREDRIYVADTYNRRIQVFRRIKPAAAQTK